MAGSVVLAQQDKSATAACTRSMAPAPSHDASTTLPPTRAGGSQAITV